LAELRQIFRERKIKIPSLKEKKRSPLVFILINSGPNIKEIMRVKLDLRKDDSFRNPVLNWNDFVGFLHILVLLNDTRSCFSERFHDSFHSDIFSVTPGSFGTPSTSSSMVALKVLSIFVSLAVLKLLPSSTTPTWL